MTSVSLFTISLVSKVFRAGNHPALRRILLKPIGESVLFYGAGLVFLFLALLLPRGEDYITAASVLLTVGAVLQRREAGLWPFRVPVFRTIVDGFVCPVLMILFGLVKIIFWLLCFLASLLFIS